ncbi:hypothetical protein JCM24511_07358 [Saitozyma sp. JCM 24511]|nr:hypothetical protein JCM24511_07358 [Saitozyma sp. JCM 24511]
MGDEVHEEKGSDLVQEGPVPPTSHVRDFTDPAVRLDSESTHRGEFGTRRDLKPRHVSMIAVAGTIGTGLMADRLVFFLGYIVVGCLVGMMIYCLGEMTVYSPNIGGFIEMGNKYISPEVGFAMGINSILQYGLAIPAEISAIAVMIGYWDPVTDHVPAYITIFLLVSIGINLVGIKYYGEVEFVLAGVKVLMLLVFILFGLIADVGGINHVYTGGRYWREEPLNDTFENLSPVSLARFLGFWKVLTQAAFAFGGIESIAVLAGETHNPRKTMRMAVRTVFYRIVGLYLLTVLMIGLNISQQSSDLLSAVAKGGSTAASSPFVVICQQVGVKVLPSVINAVVMTSALSACNENVYAVSRILLAMARQMSFCFGLLAFLSVSNGSALAFTWLSNLSALSSLIAWITVCACYILFKRALDIQEVNRSKLLLRGWFQPYMAGTCIACFTVILIFNGFVAFLHWFSVSDFFALVKKEEVGMASLQDIDLSNGPEQALKETRYDLTAMLGLLQPIVKA